MKINFLDFVYLGVKLTFKIMAKIRKEKFSLITLLAS